MENISKYYTEIDQVFINLKEYISKYHQEEFLIAENNAPLLISEAHYKIKKVLSILFGKISDSNEYGLFNTIFRLKNTTNKAFSDGAMFTYWSYHGVPYNSIRESTGKWRDNLFYKGSRFSDRQKRDNFYEPFNAIAEYCKGFIPIDYLVSNAKISQLGSNCTRNTVNMIKYCPESLDNSLEDCLTIPVFNTNNKEVYYKDSFERLMNGLYKIKEEKDECRNDEERLEKRNMINDLFKNYFESAYNEIKDLNCSKFHDFADKLSVIFPHLKECDNLLYEVFCFIVSFQFYDHAGITYLFLPDKLSENYCCLGFSVPVENTEILESQKTDFIELINKLGPISYYEKEVHKIVESSFRLKQIWKSHYASKFQIYERLTSHLLLIVKYICKEEDIKILDIQPRVKQFESFYSRMVDRYNDPGKFKISGDEIEKYRKQFLSGSPAAAEYIFSKFWDLSGIRVLCVFQDDTKKIKSRLCQKIDDDDIDDLDNPYLNSQLGIKVNYLNKKNTNEYRSEHYIIRLSERRTELIELKELSGLFCELQVTTVLSQGWSDADHDLFYKSALPSSIIETILKNPHSIAKDRSRSAGTLEDIDVTFVRLREQVKELKNDL